MHKKYRKYMVSSMFLLPAVFIFTAFLIFPLINAFIYSFTDWDGIRKNITFVGFKNYLEFFTEKDAIAALGRTLLLTAYVVVIQNFIALFFAELLDRNIKGKNFFQSVFYLPAVLSTVVVAYLWNFIYEPSDGVIYNIANALNLDFIASVRWLADPKIALFSVGNVMVWQFFGYSMVIYIAGMQTISESYYEASAIDGANPWQVFRYVKFPLLAPVFTINLIISLIGALKQFEHLFLMTQGGPGRTTETMTILIFNQAFGINRMGYGTALSMILLAIILLFSLLQLKVLQGREVDA